MKRDKNSFYVGLFYVDSARFIHPRVQLSVVSSTEDGAKRDIVKLVSEMFSMSFIMQHQCEVVVYNLKTKFWYKTDLMPLL